MSATRITTGLSAMVLTGGMVFVGPGASAMPTDSFGQAAATDEPTATEDTTEDTTDATADNVGLAIGHRCGALFAHSHARGTARATEVGDGGPAATSWWTALAGTGVATTDLSGNGLHCGVLAKSLAPTTTTDDDAEAEATEAPDEGTDSNDAADTGWGRQGSPGHGWAGHGWAGHGSAGHSWAGHQGRHHRGGAGH